MKRRERGEAEEQEEKKDGRTADRVSFLRLLSHLLFLLLLYFSISLFLSLIGR